MLGDRCEATGIRVAHGEQGVVTLPTRSFRWRPPDVDASAHHGLRPEPEVAGIVLDEHLLTNDRQLG